MEGRAVTCQVRECTKVFSVKSSFTAHISRKHRDLADRSISDLNRHSASVSSCDHFQSGDLGPQVNERVTSKATDESGREISEDFRDLFVRNILLFY